MKRQAMRAGLRFRQRHGLAAQSGHVGIFERAQGDPKLGSTGGDAEGGRAQMGMGDGDKPVARGKGRGWGQGRKQKRERDVQGGPEWGDGAEQCMGAALCEMYQPQQAQAGAGV